MSFFSSLKKAVKKVGSAHVKLATAPLRAHRAVAKAATKGALRVTKGVVTAHARVSPTALVVRRLRSAAARAPTTPIQQAKATGWRAPAIVRGAVASGGGYGGGGAAYAYDEGSDSPDEIFDDGELPTVPPPDDDEEDQELAGFDYNDYFEGGQLAGWTDDLAKIGVDLAKGAASGALTTVARGLSPTVSPKVPPPAPGMSMTAKLAIAAAVGVPVVYLLTRKRGGTPVAA
jgi:hypothetical protein